MALLLLALLTAAGCTRSVAMRSLTGPYPTPKPTAPANPTCRGCHAKLPGKCRCAVKREPVFGPVRNWPTTQATYPSYVLRAYPNYYPLPERPLVHEEYAQWGTETPEFLLQTAVLPLKLCFYPPWRRAFYRPWTQPETCPHCGGAPKHACRLCGEPGDSVCKGCATESPTTRPAIRK